MGKKNENEKVHLNKPLKSYISWPFYMGLILIAMDICIYVAQPDVILIPVLFTLFYLLVATILFVSRFKTINHNLVQFAADYSQVQRKLLKELILPYAVLDVDGNILYGNSAFLDIINDEIGTNTLIQRYIPEITPAKLPKDEKDVTINIKYEASDYRVYMRRITDADFQSPNDWDFENRDGDSNSIVVIYLYDITEINKLKQENSDKKMLAGLINIDNYDETMESVDEVRRPIFAGLVERTVNRYVSEAEAIIKKLEKDKYIFIFENKYLEKLKNDKFRILDDAREINVGNKLPVTISMGIGVYDGSYTKSYDMARAALDLALGRGGDQVVVKEGDKVSYFGGKSASVERQTRVRARVKAHALLEFMEGKEKVLVMGHKIPDADAFGSCIGIYRIAKTLNKKVNIVISNVTSDVATMMKLFKESGEYEEDIFIEGDKARELMDEKAMLVVVDVNIPARTECPELIDMADIIVVLDHHRQTDEPIKATLSYVEPVASSACEMIAEILQYVGNNLKLKTLEADAMYAGILIDTNNFLVKTGVRTFEAAAYLRKSGVDITRIRKLLRTDIKNHMLQAKTITSAEMFLNNYMLAVAPGSGVDSPTVLAAQVANELLNVKDVRASFVFTDYNGKIYISARSIDDVNVQVIMEKLGGGGHMTVAGAQLTEVSVEEAKNEVKAILEEMVKNKEI
jgi:c-di-AMP phosphodiesterase-like protein